MAAHSKENMMNANNLSVVFGPNLTWPTDREVKLIISLSVVLSAGFFFPFFFFLLLEKQLFLTKCDGEVKNRKRIKKLLL